MRCLHGERIMRMKRYLKTTLPIALFAATLPSLAQGSWKIQNTIHVGGEGGWDYLTVDSQTHRLFVPRSTHTLVIDANSGKTLADIPGQKSAHGVALVPEVGRGFISDGGGNGAVIVFDLKSYAVLGRIAAEPDADGIIYDPALKRVLVVSGDKGVLMSFSPTIDPAKGRIDPPIELGGSPEFLAADGSGKVYVNLMDKDAVAVVDMKARKVIARWPVAPGGTPVGMALDTHKKQLYIGGRKPAKLVVMSTDNGKILSALPIGEGVDATKIDSREIFASCRDGSLTVARESSPGKFSVEQVVKTAIGARTMGVDPTTHRIYLPTAGTTGRPSAKPGSFMIVVVAKQ
jgi:DNA-binding beta-propeller fold protein YncE